MIEEIRPVPLKIIKDLEELKKPNDKIDLYEAKSIIEKLEIALDNSPRRGIGLAAPQVGIHKRVAIVRIENNSQKEEVNLVNPQILERSGGTTFFNEGCLSLPDTNVNTHRFKEIFVKDDLHPAGFVAIGLIAIAIQHEIDHLDGILITDRAVGKNKIGRNDPCPCGKMENGKPIKWKKCHGKTC